MTFCVNLNDVVVQELKLNLNYGPINVLILILFVFQIFLLLFMMLYVGSYALIGRFRRRDKEDLFSTDEDEIIVYRIR